MILKFLLWLTARLPVHEDGHLYHTDGALYMGRWIVINTHWLHARIHHIATPDLDRDLHDHPANFVSVVLNGGYAEARPVTVNPCFEGDAELVEYTYRTAGSVVARRDVDRHRIEAVADNTWTLFIFLGGRRQWWGYYTPNGKVWWKHYLRGETKKAA